MKNPKYLIYLMLIFTLVSYIQVFKGFFQHDEWPTFARFISADSVPLYYLSLIRPNVAHFTPLHDVFLYTEYLVFGMNFTGYAIVSIILQIITVYLVYKFLQKLTGNEKISLISTLIFSVNASSYQATSWMGATVNTHASVIFGLLSLINFLNFLQRKNNGKHKYVLYTSLFFLISMLFKEITIGLIAVFLILIFLYGKKGVVRYRNAFIVIMLGLVYALIRLPMIFVKREVVEERLVTDTQTLSDIFINFITFPVKIFSQSLIPTKLLLYLSNGITEYLPDYLTGIRGTTEFDLFSQNITLQIFNWVIFSSAIFMIILIFVKGNKSIAKLVLFGFLFSVLNSFIYIMSPGRSGNIPVVDSRNIYLPAIGTSLFIAVIIVYFIKNKIMLYSAVILLVAINLIYLNKELNFYARQGSERRRILNQIKAWYPTFPTKTIIYTESDTSFYGMPEHEMILPYEINFGYTLMVWYLPSENYPEEFVKLGVFLYKITDQGYKEKDGLGFGYFRDYDLMQKTLTEKQIGYESVIAFRYNSKTKAFDDITGSIRNLLKTQL